MLMVIKYDRIFFFYQNSVQIIGQEDVDQKAELEIKKIEM